MKRIRDQITFKITQDHIDRGKRNNPRSCPAALALQEVYPYVQVNHRETSIRDGDVYYFCKNSKDLTDFIGIFDRDEFGRNSLAPGEFSIVLSMTCQSPWEL